MGLFSSVKKFTKKLAQGLKAAARFVVRLVVTAWTPVINLWDFTVGFVGWPSKKVRIKILVLTDPDTGEPVIDPDAFPEVFQHLIDYAKKVFNERLNVTLLPYGKTFVEVIREPAPKYALNTHCEKGFGAFTIDEVGDAGEYSAQHVAGWNAIPVSLTFPVTVFVVKTISDRKGCSCGPLTDYITISVDGLKDPSIMAHELGHACNLIWHSGSRANLMWPSNDRGDILNWFQRNLFRNSRHVAYF